MHSILTFQPHQYLGPALRRSGRRISVSYTSRWTAASALMLHRESAKRSQPPTFIPKSLSCMLQGQLLDNFTFNSMFAQGLLFCRLAAKKNIGALQGGALDVVLNTR
jgi:hypothetical protein